MIYSIADMPLRDGRYVISYDVHLSPYLKPHHRRQLLSLPFDYHAFSNAVDICRKANPDATRLKFRIADLPTIDLHQLTRALRPNFPRPFGPNTRLAIVPLLGDLLIDFSQLKVRTVVCEYQAMETFLIDRAKVVMISAGDPRDPSCKPTLQVRVRVVSSRGRATNYTCTLDPDSKTILYKGGTLPCANNREVYTALVARMVV